jgi:hypothetical protein
MVLPGSRVEVIQADVGASEAERLMRNLEEWGIDRLRIVSPRLEGPIEWRAASKTRPESMTDPKELVAPSISTRATMIAISIPGCRVPRSQIIAVRALNPNDAPDVQVQKCGGFL